MGWSRALALDVERRHRSGGCVLPRTVAPLVRRDQMLPLFGLARLCTVAVLVGRIHGVSLFGLARCWTVSPWTSCDCYNISPTDLMSRIRKTRTKAFGDCRFIQEVFEDFIVDRMNAHKIIRLQCSIELGGELLALSDETSSVVAPRSLGTLDTLRGHLKIDLVTAAPSHACP